MNIQELATVHRLGLPIKMVIIDNKYLGMVRQWQELFYKRNYAETDLSDNPDFVEIAKAYKIAASLITEEEFLDPGAAQAKWRIDWTASSPRAGRSCWYSNATPRPTFIPWFRRAQHFGNDFRSK